MAIPKTFYIGFLTLLVITGLITVINMDQGVRIDIGKNYSKFYLMDNSSGNVSWITSGTESWTLKQNGLVIAQKSSSVSKTNTSKGIVTVTRTQKYFNNASIVDKYVWNSKSTDIEQFPINHSVKITKCVNCSYEYNYGMFSPRMKLVNDKADYNSSNLLVYNIGASGSRTFNIRMFDPIVGVNITFNIPPTPIDGVTIIASNATFTVNTTINISSSDVQLVKYRLYDANGLLLTTRVLTTYGDYDE